LMVALSSYAPCVALVHAAIAEGISAIVVSCPLLSNTGNHPCLHICRINRSSLGLAEGLVNTQHELRDSRGYNILLSLVLGGVGLKTGSWRPRRS